MENFEPKILVFACNWCSYPGADNAGSARLQYSPNIRIIRTMCSGRVGIGFIMKAFAQGLDGVLVTGCHPGDCKYVFGNENAVKQNEYAKKLIDICGLNQERLGLEWISASEGVRFANIINSFTNKIKKLGPSPIRKIALSHPDSLLDYKKVDRLMRITKSYLCIDCGKCTPVCPINQHIPSFSPRKIISRIVIDNEIDFLKSDIIWKCLTCKRCSYVCMVGVDFPEFIFSIREELNKSRNSVQTLCHGSIMNSIAQITSYENIKQDRLSWLNGEIKVSKDSEYIYFSGCLPFFSDVYNELNYDFSEIARSSIKLLNEVGIVPEVIEDERCCGHDQFVAGETEIFKNLATINAKILNNKKAKFIITSCPECSFTLKELYKKIGFPVNKEIKHISQVLAENIEKLPHNIVNGRVTYQDPCRLGRYSGIYDEPRKIIKTLTENNFVEIENKQELSQCCGSSAFLNCDMSNKKLQVNRLEEASQTGAETVITTCPKCLIHWKCALKDESLHNRIKININDLSQFVIASREKILDYAKP